MLVRSLFALIAASTLCCTGGSSSSGTPDTGPVGTGASKSAVIGSAGGSVTVEGATLTVPSGALVTPQTITVTSTSQAVPAGASGFSPVYLFAPTGLSFGAPAAIEVTFTGDASRAAVFWSSSDGSSWERLATTTSAGRARASVTHFSSGFVGDGTVSFSGLGGGAGACGAAFTAGCFRCYQQSCGAEFQRCFGTEAAPGAFRGACAAYGDCICKCTSDQDCKRCTLDPSCDGCNRSSGLFSCAVKNCAKACGG